MASHRPKNPDASVLARLRARASATGDDFELVLLRYAAERFLFRLGQCEHRTRYVLKGAMLFPLWGASFYRATRDLDFTGYGPSDVDSVLAAMRDICAVVVKEDGLVFDGDSLEADPIREVAEYGGLRIRFWAKLGTAVIRMQIDIGFGNAIEPGANDVDYPTLLDDPAPRIRAYAHEAVVAEKLHAAVVLGATNSRLKDFYDLHVLATQFSFDGGALAAALRATFERRRTSIDLALPAALTVPFYADATRATQWRAYLSRNGLPGAPADFSLVGEVIGRFLVPPWEALARSRDFTDLWSPAGPWTSKETAQ